MDDTQTYNTSTHACQKEIHLRPGRVLKQQTNVLASSCPQAGAGSPQFEYDLNNHHEIMTAPSLSLLASLARIRNDLNDVVDD